MHNVKILGIKREHCFSPNSIVRDKKIFSAVTDLLLKKNFEVIEIEEADYSPSLEVDLILLMSRSDSLLYKLEQSQLDERHIINSVHGIDFCKKRSNLCKLLLNKGVCMPKSWFCSKNEVLDLDLLEYPLWVKRGDDCSQLANDVIFAGNKSEIMASIESFHLRGLYDCVVNKHIEGDLVKFYGVEGTDFFYYYYPTKDKVFSKFGNELHNSELKDYIFDEMALKKEVNRVAALLNVPIYGGDAIIKSDGSFYLIDFNDWPSFSICREEAAEAIVQLIESRIKK